MNEETRPPTSPTERMPEHARSSRIAIFLRGIAGGVVGGIVGYLLFRWLLVRGFYAMVIPGALLGLGAGLAARGRSQALAIVCALAALCLAVYAEWVIAPFKKDGSLFYFVMHLHQLDGGPVKFVMMGLGAVFAYWFGQGR